MPGEDGFATCRRIRAITQAPIFLTARTDEQSVLHRPWHWGGRLPDQAVPRVAELRARVAAHLAAQNRAPPAAWCGGTVPDPGGQNRDGGEQPLPFTWSEYAISEYLALHAGRRSAKNRYMKLLWL